MRSEDYKLLLTEVDEIEDQVGLKDYHAFAYWFIETAFGYDKQKILNSICDGTHDKGIDALLVSESEHQVTIIQSKFEREGAETQITEAEIELLAAVRNYFKGKRALSAAIPKANPSARRLLNEAFEAIYTHGFSLELLFITTHKSAPQIEPLVRDTLGFKTGEFRVYHCGRILQLIADRKRDFTPPLPAYCLPYQCQDATMLRTQPHKSWVLSVSAEHLREFVKKYEDRLFRKNVRNFLGKNRCNRQIIETIEGDPENFWYYNNGISILCDQGNLVPEHKYVRMENPQIVNGCQTARSIERYDGELKSGILVRVIESKSHDFVAKLTLYQNSSNPVKKRDLKSNDPVQVRLKRDFARRGYYLEIKRGEEFDRLSKKYRSMKQTYPHGPINNADVAKLLAAIHINPWTAVSKGSETFFDQSYNKLFPTTISTIDCLAPYLLYWQFIRPTYVGAGRKFHGMKAFVFKNPSSYYALNLLYKSLGRHAWQKRFVAFWEESDEALLEKFRGRLCKVIDQTFEICYRGWASSKEPDHKTYFKSSAAFKKALELYEKKHAKLRSESQRLLERFVYRV